MTLDLGHGHIAELRCLPGESQPSCRICGDHGFIRQGQWVPV